MKETLTSRERVIRTLNREPVDHLPIDLGSHMSTGISAFAYWHLREYLGLPTDDIWVPDVVQFLAYVDEDVRRRFHVDCILLEPRWTKAVRWHPRGEYSFEIPANLNPQQNGSGDWVVRRGEDEMRMPEGGFFFDGAWMSKWGNLSEEGHIALYAREAERIYKETPYATNYVGYSRGPSFPSFFQDLDQAVRMLLEPQAVIEENARACDQAIAHFFKINKAMGQYLQLLTIGNDMGMQNGPLCRPVVIDYCCGPFYRRFCQFVHRYSDIKVFMHNCGSIKPLIPMIIDWGVDVLNPVQISAADMDPRELEAEFGDDIIFWGGGCDTQNVLSRATPDIVAAHVRELVRVLKPGGGFVFNQVHNILGDVPPENVVAMFDAAYEESFYVDEE